MKHSEKRYDDYMKELAIFNHLNYSMMENPAIPSIPEAEEKGKNGLLNGLMRDKFDTVRITLLDILNEINMRSILDQELMGNINDELCRLRSELFRLSQLPAGINQSMDMQRNNLESRIASLEDELRYKGINLWRDISSLKRELRETFTRYQDLQRKLKIIDGSKRD